MRASMDLFRIDLLAQLQYRNPRNLQVERTFWQEFEQFFIDGQDRTTPYTPTSERRTTQIR
jgi:hypothetical protein